jgi:hypothetical protein
MQNFGLNTDIHYAARRPRVTTFNFRAAIGMNIEILFTYAVRHRQYQLVFLSRDLVAVFSCNSSLWSYAKTKLPLCGSTYVCEHPVKELKYTKHTNRRTQALILMRVITRNTNTGTN